MRDTRLGGRLKPIVGVCLIDLTTKIPWCEDTSIPIVPDVDFQFSTTQNSSDEPTLDVFLGREILDAELEVMQAAFICII